jgi:transcription initiation factor TFIIIB Brf1 subunit/transcription initiation factor TFIIB
MREARTRLSFYLAVFHLDNDNVVERVLKNYQQIYGGRAQRPGFRKNDAKNRLAMAFAICNTLARDQMPRPPHFITNMCGVSCKQLLNIVKHLNLSRQELDLLDRQDYELANSPPQDYIDVLCAHLGIPFAIGTEMRIVAEDAEWTLHGRYPTVIAAAAMQYVLCTRAHIDGKIDFYDKCKEICEALDCHQKTVSEAMRKIKKL